MNEFLEPPRPRRGFLAALGAMIGALAAMFSVPAVALLTAPLFRRKDASAATWVAVGSAEGFGEERRVVSCLLPRQDGWYASAIARSLAVTRQGDRWQVLSTECTHAGCAVAWDPESKTFRCPCHQGVFDADGRPVAGPPPRPLASLDARVNPRTGQLEVREA